jgi:hypothetical protein
MNIKKLLYFGTHVPGANMMSKKMMVIIPLAVLALLILPISAALATDSGTIPGISIVSVVPGAVVTVETHNFPADLDFDVTIGPYGSYGIDGTKVATTNSKNGETFTVTYDIPEEFKNSARLAIRLYNPTKGYYAYNWFENMIPAPVPTAVSNANSDIPGYEGFPSFTITQVEADKSVSVDALNFPSKTSVDVTMNVAGTFGIGGYEVKSQATNEKGTFTATYIIPEELAGVYLISIRIEDPASGYYGVNWFFNTTYPVKVETITEPETTPKPGETPISGTDDKTTAEVVESYEGYPSVEINAVEKDLKVTIKAMNLPNDQKFDVFLGNLGAMADGGTKVASMDTGKTGTVTATYDIPADLTGLGQISVRIVNPKTDIYGYNWFYNQTYP